MRRREFMPLLGATMAMPVAARAQQAERARRVGYLTTATGGPTDLIGVLQTRALVEGLRDLGWFDGRNITIEHRFSGSGRERMRANAKELVALNPDVIVAVGGQQLAALLAETRTIPIVFTNVADPVASGFVASLAHPGGNATGIAVNEAPITGKWLELLKEIAPQTSRVMVLTEADTRPNQLLADAAAAAAPSLGLTAVVVTIREEGDYDPAIAGFAREPGGGLLALSNPLLGVNYPRVHALAAQFRLPAVYPFPIYARSGGLISYGPDNIALFHDTARYIDQILRGANPAELSVQQPTRFVLAVNLKTAKALDLVVPQVLLARADEVIE